MGTKLGLVVEVVAVDHPAALAADLAAVGAAVLVRFGIPVQAALAGVFLADVTAAHAVIAVAVVAVLAVRQVICIHAATAIAAAGPIPVLQRHIGAGGVVGGQHRPHEAEGVADATLRECIADRQGSFTGAESVAADVGMGDVAVAGGVVGVEGFAVKGGAGAASGKPVQIQFDAESAQLNVFQGDGFGDGLDAPLAMLIHAQLHLFKLVVELLEFLDHHPQGRQWRRRYRLLCDRFAEFLIQFAGLFKQLPPHHPGRLMPATLLSGLQALPGDVEPPLRLAHIPQHRQRQIGAIVGHQPPVDLAGHRKKQFVHGEISQKTKARNGQAG